MDGTTELITIFTRWQVYVAAAVIVAVMGIVKQAVPKKSKDLGWVKALLQLGNLALGALEGLIPGWLYDGSTMERVQIGIVVGLLAEYIYRMGWKRVRAAISGKKSTEPGGGVRQ